MTRPDAVCPKQAAHKDLKVSADPATRTHHWRCECGATWTTPWRDDTVPDADIARIIEAMRRSLDGARRTLRDALLTVERAAHAAAEADEPEVTDAIYRSIRSAERASACLDSAREDLRVWTLERDRQLSRRDTESSTSRQHYIDTGNYLDITPREDAISDRA